MVLDSKLATLERVKIGLGWNSGLSAASMCVHGAVEVEELMKTGNRKNFSAY